MARKFFTTRPRLATMLFAAGVPHKASPSPWIEGKIMWIFDSVPEAMPVLTEYFAEEGQPIPDGILKSFEQGGAEG